MDSPLTNNFGHQSANHSSNQNITPSNNAPNATATVVANNQQPTRRSTRLFGASQQSVKENSKAPTKKPRSGGNAQQKSPARKSKQGRMALSTQQSELEEKNEKNKAESCCKEEKDPKDEKELKKSSSPASAPAATVSIPLSSLNAQAVSVQKASVDGLMSLMRQLGGAYSQLSRYNSRKAIHMLEEVAPAHRGSALVLGLLGRAYFELGEYTEAKT